MELFWLKIKARAYVGLTGIFYLIAGLTFSIDGLEYAVSDPGLFWSLAFGFVGLLNLMAWVVDGYKLAEASLALAAAVALGFSALFLSLVVGGQHTLLLGFILWLYIAICNFINSRLPDPFLIKLLEKEVKDLAARLKGVKTDGR
jgi:hypothetical protein